MILVPVASVPNQQLQVQLGGQSCTLNIYQNAFGLFMDVLVGTEQIIAGVICQNWNRIVRSLYLGFTGDFAWLDLQGDSDPIYTGIGTRYQLIYLEESDLPAGEG
jgi:hypothetical protein